jgi:hypothetical protein
MFLLIVALARFVAFFYLGKFCYNWLHYIKKRGIIKRQKGKNP